MKHNTRFLRIIMIGIYLLKYLFIIGILMMLRITNFGLNIESEYIIRDVFVLMVFSVIMVYIASIHDSYKLCMYRNNVDVVKIMNTNVEKFIKSNSLLTNSKLIGINLLTDMLLLIVNYIYTYIRVVIIHDNVIWNIIWSTGSGLIFAMSLNILHDIIKDKKHTMETINKSKEKNQNV